MRLWSYRFRRTTIVTIGLMSFLGGLGLARWLSLGIGLALVPAVFLVIFYRNKNVLTLFLVILLGGMIGLWRGSDFMQKIDAYDELAKSPVIIRGIAESDAIYGEKSQLTFDMGQLTLLDPKEQPVVGRISVKGFGEPMVYKGDTVIVEGKLFPTRGSRQATISFAQLEVLNRSNSVVNKLRREFAAGITSALPEPLGSFGLGLLIGQRTTLPQQFTEQLSTVGLTHIVAVSGYNLTIIVLAVHRLLHRRSKYQATMITLALIAVFLLFTGTSASIVRAALVSCLGLAAWYYGRSFKPLLLIVLAATLTAGWYPIYLWSDLGWYLSFLAFFGILVLAPLMQRRLFNKKPKLIGQVLIETTAAQIMTLPLIMYIFGKISVISILANLLIVPLVPLAMLLCLIAGLSGMFVPSIAGWLAFPARMLMTYMVDVVQLLARTPNALVSRSLQLQQMLMLYGWLIFIIALSWRKLPKTGKITDRNQSMHIGVS